MNAMQRLIRIPEVAHTMQEMSKEMMKAGIIEEMLDETFEDMEEDPEGMEEAAQTEIDKVIFSCENFAPINLFYELLEVRNFRGQLIL